MKTRLNLTIVASLAIALQLAVPSARGDDAVAKTVHPGVLHLPETPYRYSQVQLPAFYDSNPIRQFDNTPSENPITDAGATLGRAVCRGGSAPRHRDIFPKGT